MSAVINPVLACTTVELKTAMEIAAAPRRPNRYLTRQRPAGDPVPTPGIIAIGRD